MTGAALCRKLCPGIETIPGTSNAYHPCERMITLIPRHYGGTGAHSLTVAAHECGHAEQHEAIGWMAPALRWLLLGRLFLEWDASRRARRMMHGLGFIVHEPVLLDSWRGYLVPALWQTGLMLGVLLSKKS